MNKIKYSAHATAVGIATVAVFLAISFGADSSIAQQSEIDKVKAANDTYYAALSARDIHAMEKAWSRTADVVNIAPPIRPVAHVGWDAVKKNYDGF